MNKQTIQQVAAQIEQIKPDLSTIFDLLNQDTSSSRIQIINLFESEANLYVKLLIAEIVLTYYHTHNQRYLDSDKGVKLDVFLKEHIIYTNPVNSWGPYALAHQDTLKNNVHILAHVADCKPYLPKYLKSKIFKSTSVVEVKQLKEDDFTLAIFKKYVKSLPKGLTSVQVEAYLDKLFKFNSKEYIVKYIEVMLDNCPKPSIKLQKTLCSYGKISLNPISLDCIKSKYISLSRYQIKAMAENTNLPVSYSIFDDRYSEFKPYITAIPRTPTVNDREFSALFYSLIVLKYQEPTEAITYFIEQLSEHLNHPDYDELRTKYVKQVQQYNSIVNELPNLLKV